MSDLFIPKKIKVGFDKRDDTYNGRLAYVIYFDNKGVLRKEKSWESWRDHDIQPEEYDNTPQDGFCINKNVQRFNWSSFGSSRSYIRIYDPRGIEFEITPENLIGILTEVDCLKRGLEGKFVYAWKGTEIVVLPCGSEEYIKAKEYTNRQEQKVSARDLKPGCSYTTKKGEEVIYIGRFNWFEWNYYSDKPRTAKKHHIFAYVNAPRFHSKIFKKSDVDFLATLNNPDPVSNYAELVDEWNSLSASSSIERWEFEPETATKDDIFEAPDPNTNFSSLKKTDFIERKGDFIHFWSIGINRSYYSNNGYYYTFENQGALNTVSMAYSRPSGYNSSSNTSEKAILDRVRNSVTVKMFLSSGKSKAVKNIRDVEN